MFKLLEKYLDINVIKRSFIFSLAFCLLFNSSVTISKYHDYHHLMGFRVMASLFKEFICVLISNFIFFYGLSLHRKLFLFGGLFLFITGAIASYYLYLFDMVPNFRVIEKFFDSSYTGMIGQINLSLIIWLVFVLFVFFTSIKQFGYEHSDKFINKLLSAVCLFLTLNSIISPHYRLLVSYFPLQYLNSTYLHFTDG
jgi:glucan phosphoethanolaminetransferase (alkaline phosphatase superfamily)